MTMIEPNQNPVQDAKTQAQPKNIIRPAEFSPDAGRQQRRRWRFNPIKCLLTVAVLAIVAAAVFVFSARSLVLETIPTHAALSISGGLSVALGSRFLLLPGEYSVTAKAPGYYPVTQALTINDQHNQRLEIVLKKTPGLLTIKTQPRDGVRVSVNQREAGVSPLPALELSAGEHNIVLNSPRYLPAQYTVSIEGKGKRQALNAELKPAWASVAITSSPSNASITIDDNTVGRTPLKTDVLQGDHTLLASLEGYQSLSVPLSVSAGQPQALAPITLVPVAAWLNFNTRPPGANVTFNGEFKGQTPLRIAMSPDKQHQLAVFKAGYHTQTKKIEQTSGEKKTLILTLKPKLGTVNVKLQPQDATLYIDSKPIGSGSRTLNLPAHQQVIEARKPGFQNQRVTVVPRPGFEQSLAIKLLTLHQAKWANVKSTLITAAGQQMLLFHPHRFTMGASRREAGRRSNETLHEVDMKRPFYLADKEVSNAQFRLFNSDHSSGHVDGNSLDGDQQPVVNVTWEQAAAYCNWLSAQDKLKPFYHFDKNNLIHVDFQANGYRLPTEAEWAWAARTQNKPPLLKFPWGKTFPPSPASGNYADADSASITGRALANYRDDYVVSAPVGRFAANRLALFDMGGNVAEWMNDFYGLTMPKAGTVITDPVGPKQGEYRVIRGSSWAHGTITELRLSYRDYGKQARNDLGFRLARYVE